MTARALSPVLLVGLAVAGAAAPGAPPAAPVVVVELFTSQGCSSCPPADRLLSALGASSELAGRVVPLAFHVDYWNHIGWTDPFSAAEWSGRQREYARLLGSGRIFTPALVVDGAAAVVGSDRAQVLAAIERAASAPHPATVVLRPAAGAGTQTLAVEVTARLADGTPPGNRRVLVALTESGLETPVGRGENGGKTLRNDHVTRRLVIAGETAGTELVARVELELAEDWRRDRLAIVAFVQDARTGAVLGAAPVLAVGH